MIVKLRPMQHLKHIMLDNYEEIIKILSDTKNVVFAEQAILNEDLKEGIIKNLGISLLVYSTKNISSPSIILFFT